MKSQVDLSKAVCLNSRTYINQPNGTDEVVSIKDIYIPEDYRKTKPADYKVDRVRRYYEKHGYLDKPLLVIAETNEKGEHNVLLLVDEYSRYIFAKKNGFEVVPVKYITIEEYIKMKSIN